MGSEISTAATDPRFPPGVKSSDYAVEQRRREADFDYRVNTSQVDPRTGAVLARVNPLALIPRKVRNGQHVQVTFAQSYDIRGDIDHRVGYAVPPSNANPRALGALEDKQRIADILPDDDEYTIPRVHAF